MSTEFSAWRKLVQADMEAVLDRHLPTVSEQPAKLHEAMRYTTLDGGKRVRPLLVFAAGELFDAPRDALERAAAAVEMIHAYSLVHDDMPCMDDDAVRRGQPTVHVKYGQAQALLVGDALQTLGFELLAQLAAPAERVVSLTRILAHSTGLAGMAGGQAVDIAAVGQAMSQAELESMHALKTGALISASVMMGVACGQVTSQEQVALARYAALIGLAFQVADDVLDVSADAATLGKTPGKDAASNKPTFVALLGLSGAQGYARGLHQQAVDALAPLGARSHRLSALAHTVVSRTH